MAKDTGKKLADMMYGGNPEQAAFGVFPQMKPRRTRQDPEAAKNVPVDLLRGFAAGALGAPSDLANIPGMIYEGVTGNEPYKLPYGSEHWQETLPGKPTSAVGRAASELGALGGGFYTGPAAPIRAVGAIPKAIKRASQDFAMAAAQSGPNVVKPKGGNWLTGNVEKQLGRMKMADYTTPEQFAEMQQSIDAAKRIMGNDPTVQRTVAQMENEIDVAKRNNAINKWIDSNLANYVKKEMGTPEDPVRKLAEQDILHIKPIGDQYQVSSRLMSKRKGAGFNPLGEGKNEAARFWERQADISLEPYPAGSYKHGALDESLLEANPWLKNVPDEEMIYYSKGLNDLGFDHIIDVLRQDVREGRIRPEQLNKVSMEQAVRRTYEYDQEMAKKMREAQIKATEGMPIYKEYPEGYKWVELAGKKSKPEIVQTENGGWTIKDNTGHIMSGGFKSKEGAERALANLSKTDKRYKEGFSQESEQALEAALKYEGETMGHCVGGYCPDVLEGRSRIFSLRDAKGEPHVTVEVNPSSQRVAPRHEEILAEMKASGLDTSQLDESAYDAAYEQALQRVKQNRPPAIVQIKGKQNRAPKEEYLPFVQDFVRSGQWSGVGDIQNTGLIRKSDLIDKFSPDELDAVGVGEYLTKGEHDDLLLKALNARSPGLTDELGLTTPPADGMAHGGSVHISDNPDVMQLELAGGGLVKGLAKAAKAKKASEVLGEFEGHPLLITQSDRTKVGGKWLGGPGFSGLQQTVPEYKQAEAAWGVAQPATAKTILGGYKQAKEQFGKEPLVTAMIGTPTQHQSNKMVFEELHRMFTKSAKEGNLDPDLLGLINDRLRNAVNKEGKNIFPEDVSILDKNFRKIADTFDKRAVASSVMGGTGVGGKKGQIIDYDAVIRHTTDPLLLDAPTGALGNRAFTLSGGLIDRPDLHPAFPSILQGEDIGQLFTPAPRELVMRDFIEKTMREKGRTPGFMDYTRGYPPTQLLTEDILTELQKKGYAQGGAVSYAEGGEITADDLILEERKL